MAQKKLGMRYLMDVIPLDAGLVKGSHGLVPPDPADGPIWISSEQMAAPRSASPTRLLARRRRP